MRGCTRLSLGLLALELSRDLNEPHYERVSLVLGGASEDVLSPCWPRGVCFLRECANDVAESCRCCRIMQMLPNHEDAAES